MSRAMLLLPLVSGCALMPVTPTGPTWAGTVIRDGETVEFTGYPTYPGSQAADQPDGFGMMHTRQGAVMAHIDVTPPWPYEDAEYPIGTDGPGTYAAVEWIEEDRHGNAVFQFDRYPEDDVEFEGTLDIQLVDGAPDRRWHGVLDLSVESDQGARELRIEFDAFDASL